MSYTMAGSSAPLHERVAAEIRAYMARRRLSQAALARKLGWKDMFLSRRLTGMVPFDVSELGAIADALEVPPEQFFRGPDEPRIAGRARNIIYSLLHPLGVAA